MCSSHTTCPCRANTSHLTSMFWRIMGGLSTSMRLSMYISVNFRLCLGQTSGELRCRRRELAVTSSSRWCTKIRCCHTRLKGLKMVPVASVSPVSHHRVVLRRHVSHHFTEWRRCCCAVLCTGATLLPSFSCMLSVWHGYASSYLDERHTPRPQQWQQEAVQAATGTVVVHHDAH
jgi:hypothetical protein